MAWVQFMNDLGKEKIPFFFLISFDKKDFIIQPINSLSESIEVKINNWRKDDTRLDHNLLLHFEKNPISFEVYKKSFDEVLDRINLGDSYLVNLTMETPIECNLTLEEIYKISQAKYKLLVKDKFVVFSPECFVKIIDGYIYSFPMKGTIDAAILNAEGKLMNDEKELAEHYTIVDLIRNDLSQVADNVVVPKFRYLDEIKTNDKLLFSTSSEIKGKLPLNFNENLGDIFDKLLPAGSISGAPKKETLEIIEHAELSERGFYTGVFGYFDGNDLDSGVAIRFIENKDGKLIYRSGGGITSMSLAENEYTELIDKVYVPTSRKHLD